jgi:peptidyl-prolyl cis-trans isomerase A (cyclophilin A)
MPNRLNSLSFPFKSLWALPLVLAACGGGDGGFPPVVTGFKAQSVQYSRTALLYIGGNDLRSTMTVDTGGACTNPSLASNSTTSLLVVNCTVVKVGDMAFTLKDGSGNLVYQTTVTVPKPQVTMTTNLGDFTLELDAAEVPATVNNFLTYVNSGYYSNTLFHRVIPGFVVQGGGYTQGMVKKPGQTSPIVLESNTGLRNLQGTVAMARLGDPAYNSATSEFFVNLVDNTALDYQTASEPGYAVFGKVVKGMDAIMSMAARTTGTTEGFANVPLEDVTITSARQTQ